MKLGDFIAFYTAVRRVQLGLPTAPRAFGFALDTTLRTGEPIFLAYEKQRQEIVDELCAHDEKGQRILADREVAPGQFVADVVLEPQQVAQADYPENLAPAIIQLLRPMEAGYTKPDPAPFVLPPRPGKAAAQGRLSRNARR